jgi:hypothetical protein
MVSANTLFHFTKSIENIQSILSNNFSPRYCLERVEFIDKQTLDLAIPMVCFCDIPLSQIKMHIKTYGSYAIGLKKEWAQSNGISPVFYLYNNSQTSISINKFLKNSAFVDKAKQLLVNDNSFSKMKEFIEFIFYCKSYMGEMWRNNELIKDITFYNEREWRYVPNIIELEKKNPRYIINKKEYDNYDLRSDYNQAISDFKINFTPKDIKYIIISKETERINMVRLIEQIKGSLYTHNDLKVLTSKIISAEQIDQDF